MQIVPKSASTITVNELNPRKHRIIMLPTPESGHAIGYELKRDTEGNSYMRQLVINNHVSSVDEDYSLTAYKSKDAQTVIDHYLRDKDYTLHAFDSDKDMFKFVTDYLAQF